MKKFEQLKSEFHILNEEVRKATEVVNNGTGFWMERATITHFYNKQQAAIKARAEVINQMIKLMMAGEASQEEVMEFAEQNQAV